MNNLKKIKFWDFDPQMDLLNSVNEPLETLPAFEASFNAQGMYETMRFVLRLSPRNHELIDSLPLGVYSAKNISSEALQAYSTYIHETVHWWQHVGATSGLLLSLSYLGQTHSSLSELREVIATFGAKKPLKRWADETLRREGESAQAKLSKVNIAVNNALDVEYYKSFAFNPPKAAHWLVEQQHFQSVGHGYHIVYGQLLGMLSAAIDPKFLILPAAKDWDAQFTRLSLEQYQGFYWRSPILIPPVGLHAIYEGQARFIQLQFLNSTFTKSPSCQEWREIGYLSGIYVEAFESFLKLSKSDWPDDIGDPIIGLFLLICDLAINPTRGFPLDIESFEDFILDVDVGIRFARLSMAVVELQNLKTAIKTYSREEYVAASEQLTDAVGYDHPLAALEEISQWTTQSPELDQLMSEHKTFEFDPTNLPIRVFFSHFVSFSRDKLACPEFFCWPGIWMTGKGANDPDKTKIWLRHLSLFTDRGDKPGIYARKWPDRDEKIVQEMFEKFYGTMALYDLTRQWILHDGPFVCDYAWLSENYYQAHADAWGDDSFMQVYGVSLKDFEILAKA